MEFVAPPVDFTETDRIDSKKTHLLVNRFVVRTVDFLNRFSIICDQKLSEVERNLERLEITMTILEQKIASIPGMEDIVVAPVEAPVSLEPTVSLPTAPSPASFDLPSTPATPAPSTPALPEPVSSGPTIEQHPDYAKYFKMVKMGIPTEQVKMKMRSEGMNPSALDSPMEPASSFVGASGNKDSDNDSFGKDSEDGFSDDSFDD